jgi:hypothetical protein
MNPINFHIKKGYIIADTGTLGPVFVAPHAAIAFYKPGDNQDMNTHHIAYRLARSMGGKALVSSVSRERDVGIDYFRNPPTQKLALENFPVFSKNVSKLTKEYRKHYAWVAQDRKQHKSKQKIFSNFWNEIRNNKGPVVFVHRQYLNPIRHPSAIDVIPFNYEEETQDLIKQINGKYSQTFKRLLPVYTEAFRFKTRCITMKLKLEEENGKKLFREKRPLLRRRSRRFRDRLSKEPFIEVTYKRNFTGEKVKKLIDTYLSDRQDPILHIEINEFLTRRFPSIATYIIEDLVKGLVKIHDDKIIQELRSK